MQIDYPSACNAIETLLVHRHHLESGLWATLARALISASVRLHCDADSRACLERELPAEQVQKFVVPVKEEDYDTEFLDLDLAVRVVDSVEQAVDHINAHGSGHTDIILCAPLSEQPPAKVAGSACESAAYIFTRSLSSSSVFVNASSRFADGFRFGFGTEVGISTGRTHARGPVGLEGLVTYKYVLRGAGQGPQTAGAFSSGANARTWAHRPLEQTYPTL